MDKKERQLVSVVMNLDSGVCIDELYEGDSYRKVTAEQREFEQNHKTIKKSKSFTMFDDDICYLISQESFTSGEIKVLFALMPHIGYYELSGKIIKRNGINLNDTLNGVDLKKKCPDISQSTFERAIKGLEEKEVIKVERLGKDSVFYANPFIFRKGNTLPRELYNKFKTSKWNIHHE